MAHIQENPGLFPSIHTTIDQIDSLIETVRSIEMELLGRSAVREYDMQPQPAPTPGDHPENECMPHVAGAVLRLQNAERRIRVAQDGLSMLMGKLLNQGHLSPATPAMSRGPVDAAYDELAAKARAGFDKGPAHGQGYMR